MAAGVDSEAHLARVQELTDALEAMPDGREKAIVDELQDAGAPGQEIHERLVADGVVASLLLIHDLYPIDLETRVREALDSVRPYMESHGGAPDLAGLEVEGVAAPSSSPSAPTPTWMALDQAGDVAPGELSAVTLRGAELTGAVSATSPRAWRSAAS